MNKQIEQLIERYFDGDSSTEEEHLLRRYFARNEQDIPENLRIYASLFQYMDDESTALTILKEIRKESEQPEKGSSGLKKRLKRRLIFMSQVAAAIAAIMVIVIVFKTNPPKQTYMTDGNYVWVNGKQITDPVEVQRYAESSFSKVQTENNIVEDQINSFFE